MKHFTYLLMFVLLLVAACQQTNPSLTDKDKNEIETEVRAVFDRMVEGMNEHDAEKIVSCYLKSDQFHITGDGNMNTDLENWENWIERLTKWHADHQDWSVTLDKVIIDVLNREIAIVTARGMTSQPNETGKVVRRGYTVTDIFQHQKDGWIITNEHESVSDPKTDGE